ncbi:protein FAR-RED IMPAIRED RESPONSE 1-like [Abrus precatorius]|uniref:Protein FAR1-RELATED SEQUENCE n=1 Tax=Abrus precatorius TaxID=3816 RepID=A0A8B8JMN0_ABRPR|nr:protein FAR-RED IMPAIRED RESPONSE 1-like [Abrus precatorius]
MKPGVSIKQFFQSFERIVEAKRYNELICEYESRHKLPMLRYEMSPILIQMGKIYTHPIFTIFQQEFTPFLACCISERIESPPIFEYVITTVSHEKSCRVSFDNVSKSISCTCKKFETFGMLCSHALKVFEANDVKAIPKKYILKRWTKEGRSGIINNFIRREIEGDSKVATMQRYKQLASKMIRLASEVSSSEEYSTLVDECLNAVCRQISHLQLQTQHVDSHTDNHASKSMINDGTISKGFKHRPS